MKALTKISLGLVIFVAFSAAGYVIMAGSFPGAFGTGFSHQINQLSAPLTNSFGRGMTGGTVIILGSLLAGYILFGKTAVEETQS